MRRFFYLTLILFALIAPPAVSAQEPEVLLPATVVYIVDEQQVDLLGQPATVQTLELALSQGARRGEIVTAISAADTSVTPVTYALGDRVYLREAVGPGGTTEYQVAVRDRTLPLAGLGALFVLLVLAIGRGRGLRSLLALVISFAVMLGYVVPHLAAGQAPLLTALVGCGLAMPVSYYLSHGFNRKTSIALLGSLIGLLVTGLLTAAAVALVPLTGYSGDEAGFVAALYGAEIDLRLLLMAGMIIGVLGVLDDVTVAQAATVEQVSQANRGLDRWQLFRRGMSVGQDHISSMVNTLMLVYAGSSLTLLLLLSDAPLPLGYVLSQEIVAEEVVRMLVTSTGLVAAVPVTTALAAALMAPPGLKAPGGEAPQGAQPAFGIEDGRAEDGGAPAAGSDAGSEDQAVPAERRPEADEA